MDRIIVLKPVAAASASHETSCTESRSFKRDDRLEDRIVALKPVVSRGISCEELLSFNNVDSRGLEGLEDCGQLRSSWEEDLCRSISPDPCRSR